jgi:hypothetical protein
MGMMICWSYDIKNDFSHFKIDQTNHCAPGCFGKAGNLIHTAKNSFNSYLPYAFALKLSEHPPE